MPSGQSNQSANPVVWFFVVLGLLLFVSTMFPSCHSKQKLFIHGRVMKEGYKPPRFSPAPAPSGTHTAATSATPPAKPSTPPSPPPPHH